mmetsp:Transcript_26982/g.62776  ORF Transcript_26982/g.62776 Transcript_26982/m.62776 type:complete len:202 (+) Transcript_26982:288-893(+)
MMLREEPTGGQRQLFLGARAKILPVLAKDAMGVGRIQLAHREAGTCGCQGNGMHVLIHQQNRNASAIRLLVTREDLFVILVVVPSVEDRQGQDDKPNALEALLLEDTLHGKRREVPHGATNAQGVAREDAKSQAHFDDDLDAEIVLRFQPESAHSLQVLERLCDIELRELSREFEVPAVADVGSSLIVKAVDLLPILDVVG